LANPGGDRFAVAVRSLAETDPDDDLRVLTLSEREEAAAFLRQADQRRFVAGRALLRRMLSQATGAAPSALHLGRDVNGRPMLAIADPPAFNVSHSGDLVLVAVGRVVSLGVDIERHRPDVAIDAVGPEVFTADELRRLADLGAQETMEAFFRLWVAKEAVAKAVGTGLARDPRRFQVTPDGEVTVLDRDSDDVGAGWRVEEVAVPAGYSAAVAWRA
jgi:4'-phosphopantetheinyl transferase